MFKLIFDDGSDGYFDDDDIAFYDSNHHEIKLPDVNGVRLPRLGDNSEHENQFHHKDGMSLSHHINGIRLVLGYKCNLKCDYCYESVVRQSENQIVCNIKKEKFARLIQTLRSNIKGDPIDFELWGGEPWLYWKVIKDLVPIIRENFPNTVISTITNGTVITPEIADFIIDNNIAIVISYDGPSTKLRRNVNPFENPEKLKLWRKVYDHHSKLPQLTSRMYFSINVVMSPGNMDMKSISDNIDHLFDNNINKMFNIEAPLSNTWSKQYYNDDKLTAEYFKTIEIETYNALNEKNYTWVLPKNKVLGLLSVFYNKRECRSKTGCGVDNPHYLNIRLDGRIMRCHSDTNFLNSEYKLKTHSFQDIRISGIRTMNDWESCRKCPFRFSCRSVCAINDWESHACCCRILMNQHKAFFSWCVNFLYGKRLKRIEGEMKFPRNDIVLYKYNTTNSLDFHYGIVGNKILQK